MDRQNGHRRDIASQIIRHRHLHILAWRILIQTSRGYILEEGICIYGTKVFSIKKDEFLGNLKNPFFLCVLPKEMFFK
jgi:hypothetical protein